MEAKSHILYVIDSLNFGGAERQLVELVRGLDKSKYQVHLACIMKTEKGYHSAMDAIGIESILCPRLFKYDLFSPVCSLVRYIWRNNIHLVHTFMNMGSLYGALAAKFSGRPVVCSAIRDAKDSSLKEKYLKLFLAKISDTYVSNSKAGFVNRFRKIKPHYRVVYNGIDFSRFEFNIDKKTLKVTLGIDKFDPIIGMVGSLYKNKDHETLFNAFRLVLKYYPAALLLLIGDGDRRRELERLAKDLQIDKNLIFLGWRKDVEMLYRVLDVHVLLTNTDSKLEGLSNVIIEAIASGIPVVATKCGGTTEIIAHNVSGKLVKPKDPHDVARNIINILKNPEEAKKIKRNGLIKIQNMFNLQQYIANYQKIYQELLFR